MRTVSLYDEAALSDLVKMQRENGWSLEESIDWSVTLDLSKPLVALDEEALFFPGASREERLAVSQIMGLIIAASICEMEECLVRLRKQAYEDVLRRYPVSPEFIELGEQFFLEETKHSEAFRRYMTKFAHATGVNLDDLKTVLPQVERTKTEWFLKKNLEAGGYAFWWIVAEVEQEFLLLYNALAPFRKHIEPLYFDLHRKHFEEEARHASFPYLMLELMITRAPSPRSFLHAKGDLMISQIVQTLWTAQALSRTRALKKLAGKHPIYTALARMQDILEKQPKVRTFWKFFTSAPYVSSLVNPNHHRKFLRFAKKMGSFSIPFPAPTPAPLVDY
ncbi:MAG: hypothetical protein HY074_08575 [Deltaproteobacteria bacterium]|nr:hypothetical protein [Deltaproteobacteria bacterium]